MDLIHSLSEEDRTPSDAEIWDSLSEDRYQRRVFRGQPVIGGISVQGSPGRPSAQIRRGGSAL